MISASLLHRLILRHQSAKMAFSPRLLLLLTAISGLLAGSWSFAIEKDDCCPTGWTQLDNRCFIFKNERVDFITAETTCIILGGNLVSIHSNLENELVRQLIFDVTGRNTRTWIGFTDAVEEGSFIWTDGSVVDFTDWANNRPNNNGNQNCVNINFRGDDQWNDIPCIRSRTYVCAMDLKPHH
ncbi:galactose-specific lectin nattectin-like isoform X2 [Nerophis lumbriciformis]|uniref:galactose-specific lectin nattectin-like isoform X2 n=1 Tax=Nerophis lumbriciformis TaxID=546530 RepID=UPI002ADFF950|nr:galactose-specific lectin nattectin-like isoform X2 [Nerophis lumbriciformis]